MYKSNLFTKFSAVALSLCILATGCGKENGDNTASGGTADVTQAVQETTPTATPSPTPLPAPVPEWEYKITQKGYYNACASFDEDGNLISSAPVTAGENVYYNDFDEYYDNFICYTNVYNGAALALSDEIHHSGDNSVKVTGRGSDHSGLTGFALNFDRSNGLDFSATPKLNLNVDYWCYFTDDFGNGLSAPMKFAVWSNCFTGEGISADEAANDMNVIAADLKEKLDAAEEDPTINKDSVQGEYDYAILVIDSIRKEFEAAAAQGLKCIGIYSLDFETWGNYNIDISVDTSIATNAALTPYIAISTLGELNAANVSFYNPFYIDDLVVKVNSIEE